MKKIITIILAALMMLSVVMTGCTTTPDPGTGDNGGSSSGTTDGGTVLYEEGVTYNDGVGTYDVLTKKETDIQYDKSIFYRNDVDFNAPDPGVFYCSDKTNEEYYDWYFLYGTTGSGSGSFMSYKSKDLVSWEPAGVGYVWPSGGWQSDRAWAPEIIWDKNADRAFYGVDDEQVYGDDGTGCYFIFCSAVPNKNNATSPYKYMSDLGAYSQYGLDIAVAASPAGPFKQYNGNELGAVIDGVDYSLEKNYAKYTTYYEEYKTGTYTGVRGRENNEITNDDVWFNGAAARASLSFQWKNRDKAGKWVGNTGTSIAGQAFDTPTANATYVPEGAKYMVMDEGNSFFGGIDPTPFVDPLTGDYWMFFTRDQSTLKGQLGNDNKVAFAGTCIYAIKTVNNDWTQLDYSTLTRISRTQFSMLSQAAADDYNKQAADFDASLYELGHQECTTAADGPAVFERSPVEDRIRPGNNNINEGTQVQYNPKTGLYYITFSMGSYTDDSYTVIQCVGYNITGPFRKLGISEGGFFLSTDSGTSLDNISGPGHHTMLEVYDEEAGREKELVIIYHKHLDMNVGGGSRGPVVDRVVWTQNDDGLTIMHVNGPTTFVQPRLYSTGETPYDNLLRYDDASLTVADPTAVTDSKHGMDKLTDGIILIHSEVNDGDRIAPSPYAQEYQCTDEEVNITVSFDDYKTVVGFMVYNSREYDYSFRSYTHATKGHMVNEFKRVEMDIRKDGVTATAVFDGIEFYTDMAKFTSILKLRPGASANAVFAPIDVKEIRMTIKNPYYNNHNFDSNGDGSPDIGVLAISEVVVLGLPGNANVK